MSDYVLRYSRTNTINRICMINKVIFINYMLCKPNGYIICAICITYPIYIIYSTCIICSTYIIYLIYLYGVGVCILSIICQYSV